MQHKCPPAPVVALTQLPSGPAEPALLMRINADGTMNVELSNGRQWICDVLLSGLNLTLVSDFKVGARLLVSPMPAGNRPVVLGIIGTLLDVQHSAEVVIASNTRLTLQCGEASIEMRADGKVLIKGDEVTVRAKGTKRIRAGSVSIN